MDYRVPVLIVGAGPTGLTLALTLRHYGIAVRVIDRLEQPADLSKALAVWPASLELLSSLGVEAAFDEAAVAMSAVTFGDGARRLARVSMKDGIDSAHPEPLLLPQSRTEAILTARFVEMGGVIERGVELTGLSETADTVTATLKQADGRIEEAAASWLVGADGARSAVRHALDIAFEGDTEPDTYLLGDVRIAGAELDQHSIHIWWHDGGTVALFPFAHDVWRVISRRVGHDAASRGDEPPTLDELQQKVTRHGPPNATLSEPGWLSTFRINERLAARYREGRVFLAGDAAHIHSPAGGQGMNTGIQDAANLGWKLAYVLQGRGEAATLLDSYEAERRPVARRVIDNAARLLHVGMAPHPLARLARDAAVSVLDHLPALQERLRTEMAETDITYHDGPLVALGGAPAHPSRGFPGTRALDLHWTQASDGQQRTLWPLLDARHTLVVFRGSEARRAEAIVAPFADAVQSVTLDTADDPAGDARRRYGFEGEGWVLIRPDQVIALRGTSTDVTLLERYLRDVVCSRSTATPESS
ncbi:FAD-dependent monooxygenase [Paraburkholderia sp. BL21I4N1]|uniref:FAD-dependent monooxygenase n=1 Tax=Paraburkholderia sp. BL21I4N1 TaxID=1938801 RepID=UPI000D4982AD|nr:FAD-dependent monooxygenase [Paraburkholderia sp. BL21I4N1]PQV53965.1 2-polyprenyl-6-methoxyphenol hydroxylase-like FAD-dependent oxidoreductase [Paraburkholderia sp. BL21I4N1]